MTALPQGDSPLPLNTLYAITADIEMPQGGADGMILQWDESFDIGSNTLTSVNNADHQSPFALFAKLNKLTIKVDRLQLSPEDIKKLQAA